MKKLFSLLLVGLVVVTLVSCKKKDLRDPDTYYNTTSDVKNVNQFSQTLNTASVIYNLITDSLYTTDFDWENAIEDKVATKKGDFTNIDNLGYNYYPSMAKSRPVAVSADGTLTKNEDRETSRTLTSKKWQFTVKDDLKFADGTVIDAKTFEYSWKVLLDSKLANARATNLYDRNSLPLKGAEAYAKQGRQVGKVWLDGDEEVGYYPSINKILTEGENQVKLYNAKNSENKDVLADSNGYLVDSNGENILDGTGVKQAVTIQYVWANSRNTHLEETKKYGSDEKEPKREGVTLVKKVNPPAKWEDVGFKIVDDKTFEIELTKEMTQWDVMTQLASSTVSVVHPGKYEAGMNAEKTNTTYGTIENQMVSYGPYTLTNWQDGVVFAFEKNQNFHDKESYAIKKIRYTVIADQKAVINEYKSGKVDVAGVSGEWYAEYKNNPLLKQSPTTSTFRFAFNIGGRGDGKAQSPLLKDKDFRKALYLAIDREEFATTVRPPSIPQQGFISTIHKSIEEAANVYFGSAEHRDALLGLSPETYGYNAVEAKRLFDKAYAAAVADTTNNFKQGDKVVVDYVMYEVDSNRVTADWVKSTVEKIFGDKFQFNIVGLSDTGLDAAWDNKDFDLTFGGWTGNLFDPAGLMAIVYNENYPDYMLENGFQTSTLPVSFKLSQNGVTQATSWLTKREEALGVTGKTVVEIQEIIDGLDMSVEGNGQKAWDLTLVINAKNILATRNATTGVVTSTLEVANDFKDSALTGSYEGKEFDTNAVTATIERTLINEMIAIPLITSASAAVYSERVVFEVTKYHSVMGWGGLKYMSLSTDK